MDEKKSLRFKPSFIFSSIMILSIISAILINSIQIDFLKDDIEKDIIRRISNENLNTSFSNEGYTDKDKDSLFLYNIKIIEKKLIINEDIETGEDFFTYSDKAETRKATNIDVELLIDSKEPDKIDYNLPENKALFWIRGAYENGKLNYSSNIKELRGDNLKRAQVFLGSTINFNNHYISRNPHALEDQSPYCSFFYAFDTENPSLINNINNEEDFINYSILLLVVPLIASFSFAVFLIFINFESAKKYRTFNGITNIPIDLYILGLCFLFITIGVVADDKAFFTSHGIYSLNKLVMLKYFIALLVNIFAIFYSSYIVLALKSIYYDGFSAFVFQRSIIVKILKYFYRLFIKIVKKTNHFVSSVDPASRMVLGGAYLVCVFIAIIISAYYNSFSMFLLIVIFFTYIFSKLKTSQDNFKEIEKVSGEISQGDYSLKIDVDKNRFKKLAQNLNATSDSLALAMKKELKSEKLKTELITNVSHDLKTPLTSIINYSQLINDEKTSLDDIKKYAWVINEKSNKLRELIEGLFELSKVSSSNVKFNIEKIDYKELINQIAGEWEDKFLEKRLTMVTNFPDEDVFVNLDGHQSSRILENIFSNIYKYGLEDTRVYIDLTVEEKTKLIIKNISKYQLNISTEDLLERFVRGDSSRNTDGSGLGLSIASSLTKLQKGNFKIDIVGDLFIVILEF